MANEATFAVDIERHGVADFRAVVMSEFDGATVHMHAMGSATTALAEAVLWIGAQFIGLGWIREVLCEGEDPRGLLLTALARTGAVADARDRELYDVKLAFESERAQATELREALTRARGELDLAGKLCGRLAKERDDRETFIAALAKSKA